MKNIWIPLVLILTSSSALAATILSQIEIQNGTDLKLNFSGTVDKKQVRTEYLGDILQVTVDDASVYSSKILPGEGNWATKVFAYQYSPKQVRIRVSVKGKAEEYRNRLQFVSEGKSFLIKLGQVQSSPPSSSKKLASPVDERSEEEVLLEKVVNAKPLSIGASSNASGKGLTGSQNAAQANGQSIATGDVASGNSGLARGLTGSAGHSSVLGHAGPAALKITLGLIFLLMITFVAKNVKSANWKFLIKGVGKKDGKMIEVVSTHYLGPKKGITLVRVSGRMLVLGVTDHSIQLLTELGETRESRESRDLGDSVQGGSSEFSELLSSEKVKPSSNDRTPRVGVNGNRTDGPASQVIKSQGIRSMIRSRLEDLKPL